MAEKKIPQLTRQEEDLVYSHLEYNRLEKQVTETRAAQEKLKINGYPPCISHDRLYDIAVLYLQTLYEQKYITAQFMQLDLERKKT